MLDTEVLVTVRCEQVEAEVDETLGRAQGLPVCGGYWTTYSYCTWPLVRWLYTWVVEMLEWPSNRCTCLREAPLCRR